MKRLISVITVILFSASCEADGFPESAFRLDISRKGQLSVFEGNNRKQIRIAHEIFGYEVNCSKTKILVWGKSTSLNKSNPQDSTLTIVDIKSQANPKIIKFSKNIFNAIFSKQISTAIVESDHEWVIDITRGTAVYSGEADSDISDLAPESCLAFPYKSYRKFRD